MNRNLSPEEFNLSHLPRGSVGARGVHRWDSWYGQTMGVAEDLSERAEDAEVEASDWLGGHDVMQVDDTSQAGEIRETQRQIRGLRGSASRLDDFASREETIAQAPGYRRDPRRMWN